MIIRHQPVCRDYLTPDFLGGGSKQTRKYNLMKARHVISKSQAFVRDLARQVTAFKLYRSAPEANGRWYIVASVAQSGVARRILHKYKSLGSR